jgi:hypothetical protein
LHPPGHVLAVLGEHVWADDDRDERFTASLGTLINSLQAALPRRHPRGRQPGS